MSRIIKKESNYLEGYHIINELPSNFKPYDVDKIYIREYTIGETLSLNENSNDLEFVVSIMSNCIKGIDIQELTYIDFVAVTIIIGYYSTSLSWHLSSHCSCGAITSKQFNITNLEFDDLTKELPFKIENEELGELEFDAYRVKHAIAYDLLTKKLISKGSLLYDGSNLKYVKDLLKLSLISTKNISDDAYNGFFNLKGNANNKVYIETIKEDISHNIKPLTVQCKECKKINKEDISLEISDMFP